jgi:hypothetical protein
MPGQTSIKLARWEEESKAAAKGPRSARISWAASGLRMSQLWRRMQLAIAGSELALLYHLGQARFTTTTINTFL